MIEVEGPKAQVAASQRKKAFVAFTFIAVPGIVFYAILLTHLLDLPLQDDYVAVLGFLVRMRALESGKVSYFFMAQHNGYKLLFEQSIVWLQYSIWGHVDFRVLCAIGNSFVLLLAVVLWKMFLPGEEDLALRLKRFIPVAWLLFQLQYIETLNWAMASLVNLPVLVFSFSSIFLLTRKTVGALLGSLLFLIGAVASSGNGLLLIPIGALILATARRFRELAGWLAVACGCIAIYAYHYNSISSPGVPHHFNPLFLLGFLGNALEIPVNNGFLVLGVLVCPLFGLFLCIAFSRVARRQLKMNEAAFYCVIFIFTTAVAVTGMRSEMGFRQSLSSRYGMYSVLLLIFLWFVVAGEDSRTPRRKAMLPIAISATALFCITMDIAGHRYIVNRNRELIQDMASYRELGSQKQGFLVLEESKRLGIYEAPGQWP